MDVGPQQVAHSSFVISVDYTGASKHSATAERDESFPAR